VIPKITRGGNTRGLLLYLIGKGRREEHVDPHLVAGSAEAMMIAGGRVLEGRARDAAALARFLDEPRETFGTQVRIAERDQNGKVVGSRDAHVWHTSLSLHPDEPALSDERWGEIAERFIAEMGFAGEGARAQCRWVAVRHGESTGGSDHVHLVVGLVAEDGSKASVHFERKRAQQAARLLEREFGLRELESRGRGAGSRGLEPGEIAADHRRGVGVGERGEHAERSSRQRLERVVRACAGASRTEAEFVARLREQGVHARARYGSGGTSSVVGYSVRLAGPSEGRARTVWYGGGRLARDLSLPALRRGWGQEHGERQRAVAEWSSQSSAGPRPAAERQAELQERGLVWHRCTIEIERVRLGLRAAGTDPAACAHAAREGAAVLAAWSIDLEGEHPGPLARASRQLARSAELSASTPAASPRRLPSRASGLALFMLAAGRPDSAVGWLLVCRELGLLAGEIGRVHRARGELQRAVEIETELHGELEQIRARLDADRPDPGPVELDAESEAARRAREPLGPATREAPERPVDVDDVEAVRRLIDPPRRRRPRQR
jgi:relaxase-like protein